jgi:lipoprotein-anchoring transpeptidase ErfK/SrfK
LVCGAGFGYTLRVRLKTSGRKRKAPQLGGILGKLAALILVAGLVVGGWWWWEHRPQPVASGPPSSPTPVVATNAASSGPTLPTPILRAYRSNGVVVVVTNGIMPGAGPVAPAPAVVSTNPVVPMPVPVPPPATSALPRVVATNPPPVVAPVPAPVPAPVGSRPVQNVFEAQLALARRGISSGSIDGVAGGQTRAAILAFQGQQGLPRSGELDAATRARLLVREPLHTTRMVLAEDLAALQPLSPTWLGKSQQSALAYETVLEKVAEESWSSPNFIRRLNPSVNWSNVVAGTVLTVPLVEPPPVNGRAAVIKIELAARALQVFDDMGRLVAHFPCSIAARVDKRPVGSLKVQVAISDPNYTMDPAVFPESAEAQRIGRKLVVPPGPNNPVGVAWIGLSKPGYGIHGTPSPEQVGRTESHGCFRLANWNARHLLRMVGVETPVEVVP